MCITGNEMPKKASYKETIEIVVVGLVKYKY